MSYWVIERASRARGDAAPRRRRAPADSRAELRRRGLRAAQAGVAGALEDFLTRLAPELWPVARRLAGPLWGEDAVQEALVELCAQLPQLDPARDPLPYARTITARRALDLRRRERARGGGVTESPGEELPGSAPDAHAGAETSADAKKLLMLLARLPPADREVLQLLHLEEFSAAQTGKILGISTVAVRVRALRARSRLKKLWLADSPGGEHEPER